MKIAVFCGSDFGKDEIYTEAARELGQWIASGMNTLIYGGGDAGLMGVVAKEVHNAGCEVIGVVPGNIGFIADRPQPYVTEFVKAKDLGDRKSIMFERADVFVALPGGTGTLDEIAEAITLTKIGAFNKPCVLFNRNGFYEPLKKLFDEMEAAGFLWKESMKHVFFSDDVKEIEGFVKDYFS